MAKLGQVHWHEGLFLQPHHLQLMQRQSSDQFDAERRLAMPYPYGMVECRLSGDALENMMIQFDSLRVVMPSGLVVSVPETTDLPALDIKAAFESSSAAFTVYVGVPLWYATRANAIERGAAGDAHVKRLYRVEEYPEWFDENTGENPQPLLVRRINARLMLEDDDRTDMEVLPLLRVGHAAEEEIGVPRQDAEFIPPCLLLSGSPVLRDLVVRDLAHQVEATRADLVNQITRRGFSWDAVRPDQLEQILRLTTLNRFAGRLRQLAQAPRVTPFEVYLELRDLLGSLAALYPDDDQYEVPDYNHDSPAVCFQDLCASIRRLLRGKGAVPIRKVEFNLEGDILVANLEADDLKASEYLLGIKSRLDPAELVKLVENLDEFKLMPRSLARRRVFGVKLKEERFPPFGLPGQRGLHYFRLLRAESRKMWERVEQEKAVSIWFTGLETAEMGATLYMTMLEEGAGKE